jgi:trigger factor
MKFTNIKSDGMKHEYQVIFNADEIENDILDAVKEKAKTFKMHGFRQGHVPLNIVRNNVENSVITSVLDSLISKACNSIMQDCKAQDLASKPIYKFESKYEKGKDIAVLITIETAPVFDLKPYEIDITKIIPKVSEKEIADASNHIMKISPIYENAEKDRLIAPRDEVSYHAICYIEGTESKKKSFKDTLTIPENIPNDAELLQNFIGKKVGDSFNFIPATDKKRNYKITIKSIKKIIPNLAIEEYSKRKGFKNLAEFNLAIKNSLENDINSRAFVYHKNQILEALGKQYDFELPKGIVDQEMKSIIANVKKELQEHAAQSNKPEKISKSDEELEKEYAEVVRKRVLLGYVLNRIAKEENITATEQEIQNSILSEVNRSPAMAEAIIEYYSKNQNAVAYKRAEIIEHKAVSFLISKAKATEVLKTKKEVEEIVNELLKD